MRKINYTGSFLIKFEEALSKNSGMSIGEIIFAAFRKENMDGKHPFYATDEQMYTALEKFNKLEIDEDEEFSEEDFNMWVSNK